jgi:hypothetical protein
LLQLLTATPLLLWAMLVAGKRGWGDTRPAVRYLACTGTLLIFGFLLLGFFADQQRVSFHWPLPGFVALLPLAAMALLAANARLRWATTVLAGLGLALVVGFFVILSVPAWRTRVAVAGAQVGNFAGWDTLAQAVQQRRAQLPAGTRVLAGDFKIAAELGYLTGDASLPVLTHPVNDKHGRAVQLALWQLLHDTRASLSPGPWLLVASPSHAGFNGDQGYLRRLQQQLGPLPLPPPQVLQVDGGTKQYWLFVLPAVATAK